MKMGIMYTQVLQEEKIFIYNDTQIKVIGSLEAKICTKMLRNLSDKRGANFLAMTLRYGMVKIARLDDAFSEIFKLETSPVEGQSLLQKDTKRSKRKGEKKMIRLKSLKT